MRTLTPTIQYLYTNPEKVFAKAYKCGADSLRDVTAFPKVQNASELMSSCPSPVDKDSLDVLEITVVDSE